MIVDLTLRKEGIMVTADIHRRIKNLPILAVMHIIREIPEIQTLQLLHLPSWQGVIQTEVEGLLEGCIIIF